MLWGTVKQTFAPTMDAVRIPNNVFQDRLQGILISFFCAAGLLAGVLVVDSPIGRGVLNDQSFPYRREHIHAQRCTGET